MTDSTYKKIEIVGVSDISVSDAVTCAIQKASDSVRHMDWFEVGEIRGFVKEGKPVFQVVIKIGFRLD